ncbi:hypothetical protein QE152_g39841 [Popillia japonica]|uniref:Uncharacterized protein n=1 Tax=Popillia japonica TaxID=7064 RepID=A0AAW1HTK3_POPJA
MRLKLLTYDIELKYLPGKKMFIADLLSRNFLSEKYENELNIEGTVHCINRFQNRADSLYNIKKASESDTVLSQILNISLLEYRSTVIPTMGASPSELLMSRLLRTKLPAHHLKLKPKLQENVEDKLKSNQYQYKSYHDNRAKRHVTKFEPNQNVVIRRDKVKTI